MAYRIRVARNEQAVFPDHSPYRNSSLALKWSHALRETDWDSECESDTEHVNSDNGKHSVYAIAWKFYPVIADEMRSRLNADHRMIADELGITDSRVLAVLDYCFV